jgi:hypothetical protein
MSTNIRCPERAPRGRSDGPIIGCAGSSPLNRLFAMGRKRFDGLGWLAVLVFAAIVSLGAQESRRSRANSRSAGMSERRVPAGPRCYLRSRAG